MTKLARLVGLSWSDRFLLADAFLTTAICRLALILLPFRWITPWIGRHMEATGESPLDESHEALGKVQWAISAAARHVPWRCECLVQTLAAASMLRRRGLCGTVYIGVAKGERNVLRAHAWLRCGDRIVTGAGGRRDCTVISTFAFSASSRAVRW